MSSGGAQPGGRPDRPDRPPPAGDLPLADWMAAQGRVETVGANRPLVVGGQAWLVLEGTVDLFLQETPPGQPPGRRRFLGTVGPGQLLWTGGPVRGAGIWRLLGVGEAGARVAGAPGDELRRRGDPAQLADQLERLAAALGAAPAEPSEMGAEERLARAAAALSTTLEAAWDADRAADRRQAARTRERPARQEQRLDASLADLVEVVQVRRRHGAEPEDQLRQLDLALGRLGEELGVTFSAISAFEEDGADPVAARVATGGCRARVVSLSGRWWRVPGLPLLGFVDEGRRPVALVPTRRGYALFDPADGSLRPIDAELAGQCARRAYTVYPPLPEAESPWALFRRSLGPLRGEVGVLVVLGALAGLVTLLVPLVTQVVYNFVLPGRDGTLLLGVAVLLAGGAVTWGLISFSENLMVLRLSGRLEATLDPGVLDRLLRLPSTFFRRYSTGDLANRTISLQTIRQQLSGAVLGSLLTAVFSLWNVVALFIYAPVLGALALGVLLVVVAVLVVLNLRVVHHQRQVYERSGEVANELFQSLQGIGKIRIANAETRMMTRWAARFRRQTEASFAAGAVQVWITGLITALPALLAVVLYAATAYLLDDRVPGASFMALMTALAQFTVAITAMTMTLGPLLTVVPLWQRLRPILDEPVEAVGERLPGPLGGAISLRNVSFFYQSEAAPVLRDVSIDVLPGQMVAITGPSGSGKSTLIRLFLGLEQPDTGTVLYDGRDLRALDARAVRYQCGVVMQNARPLPGELLGTILGDGPGDEEDAWAAARAADLERDVRRMPMGMHTIIGEGGLAFSGGQVQRMMIARALARRPRIVFFDEATSALDDRTQARVSEHLDALAVTRVVVAHRLSTVRRADRIYVLEEGRVTESGTFDELVARDGTFRRLVRRQML